MRRREENLAPYDGFQETPHVSSLTYMKGEGYVDRSSRRPLLAREHGDLHCRRCDHFLGIVYGRTFLGPTHLVHGKRIACPYCSSVGDTVLTKVTSALPIAAPGVDAPPYSAGFKWREIHDKSGAIIAAVCEEFEVAAAA
ncbi:MAG TPA: hypothetical protein VGI19_18635 [Candidatus Cybelea sp.]